MKRHLKRLNAGKRWKILRKTTTFVVRPKPGAHPLDQGLCLGMIIRDCLGYARTMGEVKIILASRNVLVDGKRITDPKYLAGLMDVVSIRETKENFRLLLSRRGFLELVKIPEKEASVKPKKIIGKTKTKGGLMQLNFFDGSNLLTKEDKYKVGDSVVVQLPGKIGQHIALAPGVIIYLTGGKHIGEIGSVESIGSQGVTYKAKSEKHVVQKKHAFVIGEKQPCISLGKSQST
jgi:small subunit ribosomal protein S4e